MDNTAISVGAFKPSEDGSGFVLRLSETTGRRQVVHIDLHLLDRKLDLEFGPFQIKTLLIPRDPSSMPKEIRLTELDG